MAAEEGAAGGWEGAQSRVRAGISKSNSSILRIGRALLLGFIKTLWQRFTAPRLQEASGEQPPGEDTLLEQSEEEDVPDAALVISLRDCMLRIWQELSNDPEITSMVECISGDHLLEKMAEISEHLFATGINWGRIVVFFYFAYRVIVQSCQNWFPVVVNWAMAFLRDRLVNWIEQQGGWASYLTLAPPLGKPLLYLLLVS
ncbi:apoptosis regulator BAX-like isoform X2 [Tiliqua scincoides]|uniref:apoptosis regulator BAX-like isoform X2 n=1 Tax=Tiliqua scincoides TaxID=71010 RepID=UPI003462D9E0